MRKSMILALLGLTLTASAQDVYVYTTDVYTPVLKMQSVRRITFGQEGIEVLNADGQTQSTSYDQFDYFRFYQTPVPTGIKSVGQHQTSQDGVYSLTGMQMGSQQTEKLPAGIYLQVREKENGQQSVKKILKK